MNIRVKQIAPQAVISDYAVLQSSNSNGFYANAVSQLVHGGLVQGTSSDYTLSGPPPGTQKVLESSAISIAGYYFITVKGLIKVGYNSSITQYNRYYITAGGTTQPRSVRNVVYTNGDSQMMVTACVAAVTASNTIALWQEVVTAGTCIINGPALQWFLIYYS